MKKPIMYLFTILVIATTLCSGSKTDKKSADSAQVHVGSHGPSDSARLSATPTETGGKDTTGQGSGTTNAPSDSLKANPK